MDRRRFLFLSGLAGLTAGVSLTARQKLFAQQAGPSTEPTPYTGKFFLMINAGGGWDPTMVCDPKGGDVNRAFMPDAIGHAGELSYAPVNYRVNNTDYSNQRFFEKFGSRLLVLNGIDMSTNNHDTGSRFTWSGRLEDGYPPFAALAAAALVPGMPLGFLSNGGYEFTAGVTPLTRVNNMNTIGRIAYPNRPDPANAMRTYHSPATFARIAQAQRERLATLTAAQTLPTIRDSMRQLLETRSGNNLLERMMQYVPSAADLNGAGSAIYYQGLIALAGYQAGITAAANLDIGGFDTHGDHDNRQGAALGPLLYGVDRLMDRIDMLGLTDRVVVMIGSDFGRTPFYNQQNGKDHWSVSSVMMMGGGIRGGRVIGASDAGFRPRYIDTASLTPTDQGTTRLNPRAIHLALRRFAGIDTAPVMQQFPIFGEDMALFG